MSHRVTRPFSILTYPTPVPGSNQFVQYKENTHFPEKASLDKRLKQRIADPAFLESLNTMNFSHMSSEPYVPKSIRQQAKNAGYGDDVLKYIESMNTQNLAAQSSSSSSASASATSASGSPTVIDQLVTHLHERGGQDSFVTIGKLPFIKEALANAGSKSTPMKLLPFLTNLQDGQFEVFKLSQNPVSYGCRLTNTSAAAPPSSVGPLVNYPKRPPPGLAHPGMKPKATFIPKAMSPFLSGYNEYSRYALSKKGGRKTRRGNRKHKKATRRRR